MVRYLEPSNWLALEVRSSDDKIRLLRRQDDGAMSTVYTSVSGSGMSDGNWYNCKLVIGDDPGNSAVQQLRFWVDLNNNGSFELGEKVAETTVVDDDWSAGSVGLFRGSDGTNVARFDDFKLGFDNSGPEDNDFDDGGDEIAIDDNFNSNATSLVYDNNGNCTDDGVFKYVYDAWNRLVKAKHRSAANATTVAAYEYSGSHGRMTHVITNTGVENELGDGGERTSVFYYAQGGLAEERNGSGQLVRAYTWGTGGAGVPAGDLLWVELNGDPTIDNDSNPDNTTGGESSETPADARYFAHADRTGGIAALTEYDTGGTNNGKIVERHASIGERRLLLRGDQELGDLAAQGIVPLLGVSLGGRGGSLVTCSGRDYSGGGKTCPCFICDAACKNPRVGGWTTCFLGRPCTCICHDNLADYCQQFQPPLHPFVCAANESCAAVHEQTHYQELKDNWSCFFGPVPEPRGMECRAYEAQISCLLWTLTSPDCPRSPACVTSVSQYVEQLEKACNDPLQCADPVRCCDMTNRIRELVGLPLKQCR